MAKADIAALLALGAAFFIAIGNVMHQRSAQQVTDEPVGSTASLFLRLLSDRQWWLGSGIAALGFGLQAAALGLGSVLLVQALLVTSLLFALPINARITGRPVTRAQWLWAAVLAAAVAVVVTVGNPTPGHQRGALEVWTTVVMVLAPVLVACVVGARLLAGRPAAAVLLAVVSGSLWGVFAVLTKGVVDRLADVGQSGVWTLLGAPELYIWAAVGGGRDGLAAVVVPGRVAGRVAADHDGGRTGGCLDSRGVRPGRDAAAGRGRVGGADRGHRAHGGGHHRAGQQRGPLGDPGRGLAI